MKFLFYLIILSLLLIQCSDTAPIEERAFVPKVIYQSDDLIITQLTAKSFQHTSFLETQDFGNVPCNGLIVIDRNEALVIDTPANIHSSEELLCWLQDSMRVKVNAVVPTHFHADCLAGLPAFHKENIPSYGHKPTLEYAAIFNFPLPQNGFSDSLTLKVGNEFIFIHYLGQGHTLDNVVAYFPSEEVLFGGCLIKEMDATKGNLADANEQDWSKTVQKVKAKYPHLKIVIPGHGQWGGKELLDYTFSLFEQN